MVLEIICPSCGHKCVGKKNFNDVRLAVPLDVYCRKCREKKTLIDGGATEFKEDINRERFTHKDNL